MKKDTNKNSENCYYCDYCNSCNYCYYCYYCDSCDYCNSCNYCYYCYYCDSCDSCDSCNYCNYCYYCNSCNYCYYSYGLRMSERMLFCLGEGRLESKGEGYQKNNRIFNVDVTPDEFDTAKNSMPKFELPITKWVEYKNLDKDDQTTTSKQLGGLLKTLSYKDAWKEAKMSDEFKKWVKELPNFNSEIFESITGIELKEESKSGELDVITINGKNYKRID